MHIGHHRIYFKSSISLIFDNIQTNAQKNFALNKHDHNFIPKTKNSNLSQKIHFYSAKFGQNWSDPREPLIWIKPT